MSLALPDADMKATNQAPDLHCLQQELLHPAHSTYPVVEWMQVSEPAAEAASLEEQSGAIHASNMF